MRWSWVSVVAALAVTTAVPSAYAHPHPHPALEPGDPLGTVINHAIHAEGSFFTPAERAVIDRKCGHAPGQWNGLNFSINNGVFQCPNGKTVDDAEMRALLQVAQPRITARINAAMARPEVQEAIRRTANEAVLRALANLGRDGDSD